MEIDFKNKNIFLTGASRGIGACIYRKFVALGANLIAPGRNELDLSSRDSMKRYLDAHQEMDIDIFIHCAGLNELAGIDTIDAALLDRVFQVNLFSPIFLLQEISENMRQKRWGRVLFISSLYAIISREKRIAYSTSKTAITGLVRTLTLELASYNILTNSIAPGYVMTDMSKKNLTEDDIKKIQADIPTGRFQSESDIADLAIFLCSDYNQSITGQVIAVDGGFTCK